MSGRIQESKDEEKEESFALDLEIPDTKDLLTKLEGSYKEVLKQEHIDLMAEDDKKKKTDKTKKAQKQGGTICFCMVEHCRIGPFQAKE